MTLFFDLGYLFVLVIVYYCSLRIPAIGHLLPRIFILLSGFPFVFYSFLKTRITRKHLPFFTGMLICLALFTLSFIIAILLYSFSKKIQPGDYQFWLIYIAQGIVSSLVLYFFGYIFHGVGFENEC